MYRLLSWLSPSFPVGAFSYSHGLEYAVEAGLVTNVDELEEWLEAILRYGTGRVDSMHFRAAYQATEDDLPNVIELSSAMIGTNELSKEGHSQGRAFIRTVELAWGCGLPGEWLTTADRTESSITYPVAVALTCRRQSIPIRCALTAYLQAFVSNLVSAAVRLIPIGQTGGQAVVSHMAAVVGEVVDEVLQFCTGGLAGDLGSSTPMLDWVSMQHENQYTRLFRS